LDYLQLLILGLIQGITEFLPISSSAHLILLPQLAGWEDQGLPYDIAAHLGSLLAVISYFYSDLFVICRDWLQSLTGRPGTESSRLGWLIIAASVPVALCGFFLYDLVAGVLRSPLVIACSSIIFGIFLLWADRVGKFLLQLSDLKMNHALLVGLAQVLRQLRDFPFT